MQWALPTGPKRSPNSGKFATTLAPVRRIVFFRTARATGASEFLRHLAATGNRNAIHIYMDMATGNLGQIADALKDQRDRSLVYRLGNFMRAGPVMALLTRIVPIVTALLSPLTRVGATALAGLGEGILIEPFPSLATSRICRMAVTWPRPRRLSPTRQCPREGTRGAPTRASLRFRHPLCACEIRSRDNG